MSQPVYYIPYLFHNAYYFHYNYIWRKQAQSFLLLSPAGTSNFLAVTNSFSHAETLCHSTCPDITPESVTWCVQIAYLEKNVEVCVRPGPAPAVVITNILCEAELVGLANYLSFPSVSLLYHVSCVTGYYSLRVCRIVPSEVWAAWDSPIWIGFSIWPTSLAL